MTFGVSCHFWFNACVTHTLGPWFNPLFPLGTATILKASFLAENISIQYLSDDIKIPEFVYQNPNSFHICAEESSEANVQSKHRIKQCMKYISHDSCPVQHYLVVFPIQVHIHLGLRRCSHLKRYIKLKMLDNNIYMTRSQHEWGVGGG